MGTHRTRVAQSKRLAAASSGQRAGLKQPDGIGKSRNFAAIDGSRRSFTIEDEIFLEQRIPEKKSRKLICLQRLRFDDRSEQYRFCYYMLGVRPGREGRWVFGQYALFIPAKDLRKLIHTARERGWKAFLE